LKNTLAIAVTVTSLAGSAQAALPIVYGDRAGTTAWFRGIQESSNTDFNPITNVSNPLWGSPTVVGDAITFTSMAFGANANTANPIDLTDGTLSMVLEARPGFTLNRFTVNERGDYTLAGPGGPNTRVSVALRMFISILDINGMPAAGGPLAIPSIPGTFNNNGNFNLASNPGLTVDWNGTATIDLDAYLASIGRTGNATRISLILDNTLFAQAEAGSVAFIKKKEFQGFTVTVPTPGAAALLVLGGLAAARRRRL
jgi:MYXO-CTERM domain-containing protein